MPTIPNTSVKWITSEMRGAPTLNRQPGTLLAVLDAFLVTGWGMTTALSVSVADGIATATLTPGETFFRDSVVLIEGATPSALNGEARVLSMTNSSITWATEAEDGTATGTITIKYAPQSAWQKVFSATNRAAYRSTHVQSNGHYLYVDDSALMFARVIGYEEMSDIDTGVGPFPTPAQLSGGGYWHKSTASNNNAAKYRLFADERFLITAWMPGVANVETRFSAPPYGFGDPEYLMPGGDAWGTILSSLSSSSTSSSAAESSLSSSSAASSLSTSAIFAPRGAGGLGSCVLIDSRSFCGTGGSGSDLHCGQAPSSIDGKIMMARLFLKEQGTSMPPRALTPGIRYIPQSGVSSIAQDGDILDGNAELAGRRLMVLPSYSNYSSSLTDWRYLVDITGPWR